MNAKTHSMRYTRKHFTDALLKHTLHDEVKENKKLFQAHRPIYGISFCGPEIK